ncbi:hypothetical protein SPHINGO8BC_60428 [Sphingobacterium multivorum]|uniref:Uncharacterized protein n=1 Tax=Sphingobacterium multivorum TaxID=28454 RepID=A0A654DGV5_SPHMU|nr:hypothetical protein SPHINGO8BC_60428 [Sphingobacterium multivorum]
MTGCVDLQHSCRYDKTAIEEVDFDILIDFTTAFIAKQNVLFRGIKARQLKPSFYL